jgi:hypothetical protein
MTVTKLLKDEMPLYTKLQYSNYHFIDRTAVCLPSAKHQGTAKPPSGAARTLGKFISASALPPLV